jgi:hypothetical protein
MRRALTSLSNGLLTQRFLNSGHKEEHIFSLIKRYEAINTAAVVDVTDIYFEGKRMRVNQEEEKKAR